MTDFDPAAYDLAQATVLGNIIKDPTKAALAFALCPATDFTGTYQTIALSMHRLRIDRVPITFLSLVKELTDAGQLQQAGGTAELARVSGFDFDLDYALHVVAEKARLRQLWVASTRAKQQIEQIQGCDPRATALDLIRTGESVIARLDGEQDTNVESVDEFLHGDDDPYDWVIPGLLERTDRFVLTGFEGLGKSSLLRQIAVCTAAGIHPFTGVRVPQQRVLLFDCENSRKKMRRELRPLILAAKQQTGLTSLPLFVEARPSGLDLTRPEDEADLIGAVTTVQPALLVTGPSYRLHAKNPNDEEVARAVTVVLDRARAAAQTAVILEAHSGHGNGDNTRPVRPVGSSLWLRWPEFGYGLRPVDGTLPSERIVDVVAWRGPRDERDWPTRLRPGGLMPWRTESGHEIAEVREEDELPNRYERNAS